jgi:hypothetical protein
VPLGSLGGLDAEFDEFAVCARVGNPHRSAAHGAVFDVRLLGNRQIEGQIDGLPAIRAGGVLALKKVHRDILDIMAKNNQLYSVGGRAGPRPFSDIVRPHRQKHLRAAYTWKLAWGVITRKHGADRYFET